MFGVILSSLDCFSRAREFSPSSADLAAAFFVSMKPLVLNLHWGGQIVFNTDIGVSYDPLVPKCSTLIREKWSYSELLDLVYSQVGITKEEFKVNILYRYPDNVRSKIVFCALRLHDDDSVEMFFEVVGQLGSFIAELYIETEPVSNLMQNHQNERQNSHVPLLNTSPNSNFATSSNLPNPSVIPESVLNEVQIDELTSEIPERVVDGNSATLIGDKVLVRNDSDKLDRDGYGDGDGDGNDCHFEKDDESEEMHFVASDSDSGKQIPVWSEDKCQIQLGMRFKDKDQVKRAISLWSGRQKRRYKVSESNANAWVARCKSEVEAVKWGHVGPNRMPCLWKVRAVWKGTHKTWQITIWVTEHSCVSVKRPSSRRNWTAPMIANCIRHLVEQNPCYTVKDVQKYAKEEFDADISYQKGWIVLQKALQLINGT